MGNNGDLITWNDDYSVKIKAFDDDHKKIIKIINDLYHDINNKKISGKLDKRLEELIEYGKHHFLAEEEAFDKYGYPDKEEYKLLHKGYSEKMQYFQDNVQGNEIAISFELMDFLEDWLINHINDADKKYVVFLNKHGLR